MNSAFQQRAGIAFGRFLLLPDRRDLLADGRPVKLGGRAFDVLMALIEVPGAVVSKDALMARVWPNRTVEEHNLTTQIVALRKAFASERRLIRTVSRRGYQFTGEIRSQSPAPSIAPDMSAATSAEAVLPPTNLPEPVTELIGREEELAEVLALLASHRFVSLMGPGGIGKTRLALAAARQLLSEFSDGVWLVEFSPLADSSLVATTVAAAAGLQLGGGDMSPQLVSRALKDRRTLLILDTCEHVIDAAAVMAEALLQAGSAVRIVATSREPLRAEGEQVYQVPRLTLPAMEAADPWQSDAVRLFVARSRTNGLPIAEDQHIAPTIARICQQLDGIPLAIELAAGRAATLGIEALAARLDDRFGLLTAGRRTALPRHQTLRSTLDWSHDLLSEPERIILRRLAVFAGSFSVEAAGTVAADSILAPTDVVDALSNLVTKSLVAAEIKDPAVRYRLLDTTRAYALEKLEESGDGARLLPRHASYYRDLFERAEIEWDTRPTVEWLDDYGWCIDNLRAALDWAFTPPGDASLGVALTVAAVPLWMHLSLHDECRSRAGQALAVRDAGDSDAPRREMKLCAALATASYWGSAGVNAQVVAQELGTIWMQALAIAERLGDAEYQLRSLWGLYSFHVGTSQFQVALGLAQRFRALAAQQRRRNDELIGDRLVGFVQHMLGDQATARRHTEHMIANFIVSPQRSHEAVRFQFDQRVAARTYLARILWVQGYPDEAVRTAIETADEALEIAHAVSLAYALGVAVCPIMLWVGDLAAAERYIAMLLDHSAKYALHSWGTLGRALQGVLVIMRGGFIVGLSQLRAGLAEFGEELDLISAVLVAELIAGFLRAGQIDDGLAAADRAIERAGRTGARWLISELLRMKGELFLLQPAPGAAAAAEDHFRQSLDWAQRQHALSLELRAATSLARLLAEQGRPTDARALLQPVYDRFTEGFDTADMKAAGALLGRLE